jgi:hypothetical protein
MTGHASTSPAPASEVRNVAYARRRAGDTVLQTLKELRRLNRTQWQISDKALRRGPRGC